MTVIQVPIITLQGGAVLNTGVVLDSDTVERFYVVGIATVGDTLGETTVIVLRNLENGITFASDIALFESERADGLYKI